MPDLDALPFPDRDLLDSGESTATPRLARGALVPDLPALFLTIIAGRGCKYNRNFASHIWRCASVPANIVAELKLLRDRYHFASFMFHDDCLTENRGVVLEFCDLYQAEGSPSFLLPEPRRYHCQERMVARMAQVGAQGLFSSALRRQRSQAQFGGRPAWLGRRQPAAATESRSGPTTC